MGDFPNDATIEKNQFVIRDFVVGSSTSVYANVTTDGTDVNVSDCSIASHYLVRFLPVSEDRVDLHVLYMYMYIG